MAGDKRDQETAEQVKLFSRSFWDFVWGTARSRPIAVSSHSAQTISGYICSHGLKKSIIHGAIWQTKTPRTLN